MALAYTDLMPGDLVLCYGWNAVGKLQGIVKGGSAIMYAATGGTALATKIALGRPLGISGSADCNHALVVGAPQIKILDKNVIEIICAEVAGATYELVLNPPQNGPVNYPHVKIVEPNTAARFENISNFLLGKTKVPKLVKKNKKVLLVFENEPTPQVTPRICHSTGSGCKWNKLQEYFGDHGGTMKVFRLVADGTTEGIRERAGEVAAAWANVPNLDVDPNGNHYSKWKAFLSAFGSSSYGSDGKKRAEFYFLHRETLGGPPSTAKWHTPSSTKKDFFCSMFAIACFQAAMYQGPPSATPHALVQKYLALDSKNTSPMTLDGYVSKSRYWTKVGQVP